MTEQRVRHRLTKDKALLAGVGLIALRHGQLDNQLRMTLGDLAGLSKDQALDATMRTGSRDLRERIGKLAKQRLGEGKPLLELQALLQRASRVAEERNRLLHAVWGTELDGGLMMRHDDHFFRSAPTLKDLRDLDERIIAVLDELITARKRGFLHLALAKKLTQNPTKTTS